MDDYTILPGNQQMIRGIPIGRLNKLEQEVAQLEQNPGGSPGGSPTQLQYNNSGYFGGVSNSSVDTSSGAVGLGQTSPQAVLHVTPTPSPTSLSAVISSLGAGFYLLGSGDKEYNLYAKNSTVPIFASAISTTFTEPASTDFDPSGAGAVINTGESGYIASGFDFTYTIWALYGSSTAISVGSTSFGSVSDFNDGSPYAVDVSWSAPIGSVSPDAYLVQVTGSNPNSGLFQVVGGFPFTDSNTGWTSSASYNALSYNVALSWGGAATPIDGYVVQNGTTGTYETIGNTTSATDDGSWTVGVPVTTPIGKSKAAIFDGADMDVNGVSYHWPSSLGSGGIWKVDNTGDFFPSSVFQGDIPATNNLLVYGNGNALFQSINAFFDNNSMKFTSAFGTTVTTDNSSSGTLNNYSTVGISAVRFGGGSVTITGFTGGYSGKYLILITPVATTITLKNENTGSTAANRILTYNAVDNVIPASSAALLVYDPSNNRWRPISLGKVDPTITANTWALNQTFTDAANLIFGTSTGTKIGTSTTQKLAFYNSTPIVKPTGDVITALQNIGLIASATIAASTISSSFGANESYSRTPVTLLSRPMRISPIPPPQVKP